MKFEIDKELLQKSISAVEGIISQKNSDNVFSNILLKAENDKLSLISSDSDIIIKSFADAIISESGSITLPAKKFSNIIRSLDEGIIEIGVTSGHNLSIIAKENKVKFNLLGSDSNDYPLDLNIPSIDLLTISQLVFKNLIQKTFYASAHNDDKNFIFNSIYVETIENNLRMVATNGRRLAYIQYNENIEFKLNDGIAISSKTVGELQKLLQGDELLYFNVHNNQIFFKFANVEMSSRLLQGKFPEYEKVIPNDPKYLGIIDRVQLVNALRRVSLMANDASHQIKCSFLKGSIVIEAQTQDLGSAKEELEIDYADEDVHMGFNSIYLLDALKEIETDKVLFKFTSSEKPAIICPENDDNYLSVIMPLRIN